MKKWMLICIVHCVYEKHMYALKTQKSVYYLSQAKNAQMRF